MWSIFSLDMNPIEDELGSAIRNRNVQLVIGSWNKLSWRNGTRFLPTGLSGWFLAGSGPYINIIWATHLTGLYVVT